MNWSLSVEFRSLMLVFNRKLKMGSFGSKTLSVSSSHTWGSNYNLISHICVLPSLLFCFVFWLMGKFKWCRVIVKPAGMVKCTKGSLFCCLVLLLSSSRKWQLDSQMFMCKRQNPGRWFLILIILSLLYLVTFHEDGDHMFEDISKHTER